MKESGPYLLRSGSSEAHLPPTNNHDMSDMAEDHCYFRRIGGNCVYKLRNRELTSGDCMKTSADTGEKVDGPKTIVCYNGKTLSLTHVQRRNQYGESLLHRVVQQKDICMLRDILRLGPNLNMADKLGYTALHEAALRDQYKACVALMNSGALVNATTRLGITPLHEAVRNGHQWVAELLLIYGANPLLKDNDGRTALDMSSNPLLQETMHMFLHNDNQEMEPENIGEEVSADVLLVNQLQDLGTTASHDYEPNQMHTSGDVLVDFSEAATKEIFGSHTKDGTLCPISLTNEHIPSPTNQQLCSVSTGWSQLGQVEQDDNSCDSSQTFDYLNLSSQESEEWDLQPTQNFSLA